jgi:hypothetical protein
VSYLTEAESRQVRPVSHLKRVSIAVGENVPRHWYAGTETVHPWSQQPPAQRHNTFMDAISLTDDMQIRHRVYGDLHRIAVPLTPGGTEVNTRAATAGDRSADKGQPIAMLRAMGKLDGS